VFRPEDVNKKPEKLGAEEELKVKEE